jgi:hypothetical protein
MLARVSEKRRAEHDRSPKMPLADREEFERGHDVETQSLAEMRVRSRNAGGWKV